MVDSAFRSTCAVLDVEGKVVQLNDYYPFGLPYSDTGSMKGTDIQPYKYNGKEFQTMHGLHWYDYGARMYDPIICRWNAVDPLAEKFYNVTPYSYCLNNSVNAIDPDGRFPYKWQAAVSRWFYNLFHKTNASPIYENREAQNSRYRYTYNTFSPLSEKEFVITCNYKFDTKWTQQMQDAGDGAALVGYGLTLTGAEVGVPMSVVGNAVSSFGSGMEMVLDFANGDYGNGLKSIAFKLLEKGTEKVLNKFLPGFGKKIGEEGFNLGTEILDQGRKLKQTGVERLTDKIIERKQEEYNEVKNMKNDTFSMGIFTTF